MKLILLYGFLGQRFGRVHRYDVKSPAEAVRALCCTVKGFRQALAKGGAYRVLVGGKQGLTAPDTLNPVSDRESIRIVPVVAGAGRGLGQLIVGAALIYFAGPLGGTLGGTFGVGAAAYTSAFTSIGFSLVLGGVSQMLFAPKGVQGNVERPENKPSFTFDGAVNTATQGNPVALLFGGPLIVGSQVISAGLSTEETA